MLLRDERRQSGQRAAARFHIERVARVGARTVDGIEVVTAPGKSANSALKHALLAARPDRIEKSLRQRARLLVAFFGEHMGGEAVDQEVSTWAQSLTPVELAVRARQASARLRIESGHFILRHAFSSRRWPEGMTALRFLSEDLDPESALLAQLQRHLDIDRVSEDLRDLLMQVTGWKDPA